MCPAPRWPMARAASVIDVSRTICCRSDSRSAAPGAMRTQASSGKRAHSSASGHQHRLADSHQPDRDSRRLARRRIAQIDAGIHGAPRPPELALRRDAAGARRRARAAAARRRAPDRSRRTRPATSSDGRGRSHAKSRTLRSTAISRFDSRRYPNTPNKKVARRQRRSAAGSASRSASDGRRRRREQVRNLHHRAPRAHVPARCAPPPDCEPPRRARAPRSAAASDSRK